MIPSPPPAAGDLAQPGLSASASHRAALLVALLGVSLYAGCLQHEFVWDDHNLIVTNPRVTAIRYLPRYFTEDVTTLTSGNLHAAYYRPFFWISLLLDYLVWGLRPAGFYLTNVLLYGVACWLVFRFARLYLGHAAAACAAVFFALHPAHVESVAWVSGRCDPLAAIGTLAAVVGYLRARSHVGIGRLLWTAGSLAAYTAALLSKEAAAFLPLVLAWIEITLPAAADDPKGSRMGRLAGRVAPYVGLTLFLLLLRGPALARMSSERLGTTPIWERLPGAAELIVRYALLMVAPFDIQPLYALPRPTSIWSPWPLAGLLLLIAGMACAWRYRRWPGMGVGATWLLLSLVPVLDILPAGPAPLNFAPRYAFLPTVGLSLILGAVLDRILQTSRSPRLRRLVVGIACATSAAWALASLARIPTYQNDLVLFSRIAADAPHVAMGHQNLGLALLRAGDTLAGVASLERAAAIEPGNARAQLALAGGYVIAGRPDDGLRRLDLIAPHLGRQLTYIQVRAAAHLAKREPEAAIRLLASGLERYPESDRLLLLLGQAWELQGNAGRAEAMYRQVLRLFPDSLEGHMMLSWLLRRSAAPEAAPTQGRP